MPLMARCCGTEVGAADEFSEEFASRVVGFLIESLTKSPFHHEKEESIPI
jgi:hypothetical protein